MGVLTDECVRPRAVREERAHTHDAPRRPFISRLSGCHLALISHRPRARVTHISLTSSQILKTASESRFVS
eukprot:6197839-Pleurochrysis_carterae.AAC.1